MDDRLPYYMAYPMPLLYDDDRIARRDLDYMKALSCGGKTSDPIYRS